LMSSPRFGVIPAKAGIQHASVPPLRGSGVSPRPSVLRPLSQGLGLPRDVVETGLAPRAA